VLSGKSLPEEEEPMITLKEDFMVKALFLSKEIILKQFVSDVLGIPMEEIFSVRISNPYLRKSYAQGKIMAGSASVSVSAYWILT